MLDKPKLFHDIKINQEFDNDDNFIYIDDKPILRLIGLEIKSTSIKDISEVTLKILANVSGQEYKESEE